MPQKKNEKSALLEQIETFIEDKRESQRAGWAPVTEQDMATLNDILVTLINLKWQPDPDGDRPINFILIDRTQYEPMRFLKLPYIAPMELPNGKQQLQERILDYLDRATHNAQLALERLQHANKFMQFLALTKEK